MHLTSSEPDIPQNLDHDLSKIHLQHLALRVLSYPFNDPSLHYWWAYLETNGLCFKQDAPFSA